MISLRRFFARLIFNERNWKIDKQMLDAVIAAIRYQYGRGCDDEVLL